MNLIIVVVSVVTEVARGGMRMDCAVGERLERGMGLVGGVEVVG